MATLKLKKLDAAPSPAKAKKTPVRGVGAGVKNRPTLAEAQAERAEREARYQEQLRQRFGDRPPENFVRRGEPPAGGPRRNDAPRPGRNENTSYPRRDAPQDRSRREPQGAYPRRDEPAPRPRRDESAPYPRRDQPSSAGPRRDNDRPRRDDRSPRSRPNEEALRNDPSLRPRAEWPKDAEGGNTGNSAFGPRTGRPSEERFAPSAPPRQDQRRNTGFRPQQQPDRQPDRPAASRGPERNRFGDPIIRPAQDDRVRNRPPARSQRDDDDDEDDGPFHAEQPGSVRLSKRMSELGMASRREADEWIPKGWVRVDGRVVSELGSRVTPDQHITIDAKARNQQAARVTILLNKPVGYVSGQAEDGYEPAIVLVKPENQWREDRSSVRFLREHLRSLAPAGRLDIDSVGLLVLTQDGRVAKQLIGDESDVEKEYLVRVEMLEGDHLADSDLALLNHGLELDGEALRPAVVEWVNDDQLRFVLKEGKKRQIRRMCEAVGLKVLGLKRVRIGNVMLGDLPAGHWRYLRGDEKFA